MELDPITNSRSQGYRFESGEKNPNWQGGKTIKYCTDCGKRLCANNKSGLCRPCSTKGERNPFYGKKHDSETRKQMSDSQQKRDPNTRSGGSNPFEWCSIRSKASWARLSKEQQEVVIERLIESGRNAKRKTENTEIEQRVKAWLFEWGIPFTASVQSGKYTMDIVAKDRYAIECNGDFWHANPSVYCADWINPETQISARQKWDMDEKRRLILESEGYHVLVLWETDILRNPEHAKDLLRTYLGISIKDNDQSAEGAA